MKKLLFFLVLTSFVYTAKAYRLEWGRTLVISQPVHEDLYIAGGNVTINAPVYGDLVIAGGTLNLNDTVANDLLLAGGTVNFNGYVGDDVRCAGGELHVLKNIGGDLVITGGKVDVAKEAVINGELLVSGGDVLVNGTINGGVKSAAGNLIFNGVVKKSFETHSGKLIMNGTVDGSSVLAARTIEIGNNAVFQNNVRYWNKSGSLNFNQAIKNGKAYYDPSLKIKGKSWYLLGTASVVGLIWYLSVVMLFTIIIQYLFSNTLKKAGTTVASSMAKSLLWGFLFFVGVPVLVALLMITIIGIPIGLLLMFSYVGIIILATIIASLVMANWYNNKFQNDWGFWKIVLSAFALFILFKLISFTPFLGWLIMLVIAFIAFGSILRNIDWRRNHKIAMQ